MNAAARDDAFRVCFYLSHASSPPLAGGTGTAPDMWVRAFFDDLTRAVKLTVPGGAVTGYYDQQLPFGPQDRDAALRRAIGTADVFVPLYSPNYLSRSRPGQEWACFEQRLTAAGISDPMQQIAPVLWVPMLAGQRPPGLRQAEDLAPPEASGEYLDNGLMALMRLELYRRSYELVVGRLADRIATIARQAPLVPSPVPDIARTQSKFAPSPEAEAAVFVVAVAAPALRQAADGSNRPAYGTSAVAWRPFPHHQDLPLADHAAAVAERFDFAARTTDAVEAGDLLARAPGILLIDPWYLAADQHSAAFRQMAANLPSWILPVLIPDPRPCTRAEALASDARTQLGDTRTNSPHAKQAFRGISSQQEFLHVMPFLVAEAEREFLRHRPASRATANLPRHRTEDPAPSPPGRYAWPDKSPGHAFISYVREDSAQVARLQARLQAAGIPVWRDVDELWPGEDWRKKVRHAITDNALVFLACFSTASNTKRASFQYEELRLAVQELRTRNPDVPWLIPVRLDECHIPDLEISPGQTLQSFHYVNLFGADYDQEATTLIKAVKRML